MAMPHDQFAKRIEKLERKHEKMTYGYASTLNHDGLLVAAPRGRGGFPGGAGLKFAMFAVCGFFAFKAFALAAVGPVSYNSRVAELRNGLAIEAIGAKVLEIDPITQSLAEFIGPVLRN